MGREWEESLKEGRGASVSGLQSLQCFAKAEGAGGLGVGVQRGERDWEERMKEGRGKRWGYTVRPSFAAAFCQSKRHRQVWDEGGEGSGQRVGWGDKTTMQAPLLLLCTLTRLRPQAHTICSHIHDTLFPLFFTQR